MTNLFRLKKMSDSKIQSWLRTVEAEDLKRAMPGRDGDVRNCILRNMSPKAMQVLKESLANNRTFDKQVIDLNMKKLETALDKVAGQ